MPLEQANYIHELVDTNPVGSTDLVSEGDDHLRLIKKAVKQTFPEVKGAVSASHTEINYLDSVTGKTGSGQLVLDTGATVSDLTAEGLAATGNVTIKGVDPDDYARLSTANTYLGTQRIEAVFAQLQMQPRNPAPDQTLYEVTIGSQSGELSVRTRLDDGSGGAQFFRVDRSGPDVTRVRLTGGQIMLNGVDVADYARLSRDASFSRDVSVDGTISGDGSGLTHLNADALLSGKIPGARFPATLPAASGENLTNLNASALTGTVSGARLGGNQTMAGNKTFSDNVTIGGVARKGSAGGFAFHASANNLGGRITISSSEATTAAQVGDPGDMRFVYL